MCHLSVDTRQNAENPLLFEPLDFGFGRGQSIEAALKRLYMSSLSSMNLFVGASHHSGDFFCVSLSLLIYKYFCLLLYNSYFCSTFFRGPRHGLSRPLRKVCKIALVPLLLINCKLSC